MTMRWILLTNVSPRIGSIGSEQILIASNRQLNTVNHIPIVTSAMARKVIETCDEQRYHTLNRVLFIATRDKTKHVLASKIQNRKNI